MSGTWREELMRAGLAAMLPAACSRESPSVPGMRSGVRADCFLLTAVGSGRNARFIHLRVCELSISHRMAGMRSWSPKHPAPSPASALLSFRTLAPVDLHSQSLKSVILVRGSGNSRDDRIHLGFGMLEGRPSSVK